MPRLFGGGIVHPEVPTPASAGDYVLIERAGPLLAPQAAIIVTVSGAAERLIINGVVSFENAASDANLCCRINGDTAANYEWWQMFWTGLAAPNRITTLATNRAFLQVSRGGVLPHTPDQRIWFDMTCENPGASDWYPSFSHRSTVRDRASPFNESAMGFWTRLVQEPVATLTFFDNLGSNFSPGSTISLYGTN